ncbi:MAG: hypothetical protein ACYSR4_02340 [Planctomycetota bacterium]|jgi:hypothetical protein
MEDKTDTSEETSDAASHEKQNVTSSDKLQRSMKRWCLCILASVIGVGFCFLVLKSLGARIENGVTDDVADLPYVGKYLKDLKTRGEIRYASWRQYNRPYSGVLFTGQSSSEDVKAFFDTNLGSKIEVGYFEYGNVLQPAVFKRLRVDPKDFPQGRTENDFVARRGLTMDGWNIFIWMSYRVDDEKFTAKVEKTPQDYQD